MKLVFVTQVLDAEDAVLGFVVRWVQGLAKHCERVCVLALEVGDQSGIPTNVEVHELGRRGRLLRFLRYRKHLARTFGAQGYDALLAHMVPRYASLADGSVRKNGGRSYLWYTHKGVDARLLRAIELVDKVFTASDESLRVETPKKLVTGHGIDLAHFAGPRCVPSDTAPKLLAVGRLTPAKDPITVLRGLAELHRRGLPAHLEWVGAGLVQADAGYTSEVKALAETLGLKPYVNWLGMVPYTRIAGAYLGADLLISSSRTGSVDKVVLEAMASRLPVLASGEAYPPLWTALGAEAQGLQFLPGDAKDLASKVEALWALRPEQRLVLGDRLREIVARDHEVDGLMGRLVEAMRA